MKIVLLCRCYESKFAESVLQVFPPHRTFFLQINFDFKLGKTAYGAFATGSKQGFGRLASKKIELELKVSQKESAVSGALKYEEFFLYSPQSQESDFFFRLTQ